MYEPLEARTWRRVALMVLYVPIVSISITVRKPFSDNLAIGARKFPAAPTSMYFSCETERSVCCGIGTANNEVNSAKLLDCLRDGVLQLLGAPHIGLGCQNFAPSGSRKFVRSRLQTVQSILER